ncbi:MAG: MFS transporter [Anaerolineae bacterium]|nr:MFS transporter [Anaerolineae bacterium]
MLKTSSFRDALRFIRGNNLIFALTDLLGNFTRGMVIPYVSFYILALGGDTTQIGLVNSISPLAGLLMFPISGYIADHASRVRLVVLGSCFSAAIILLDILAPTWQVLAVAALLQGFVVFALPARSALIADSLPPEDRGRGIAAQNTLSWGLTVFAPYIGGIVVDTYGPKTGIRILYWTVIVAYIIAATIQTRFLKETTVNAGNGKRLTLSMLRSVLWDAYRGFSSLMGQLPGSLQSTGGGHYPELRGDGRGRPFLGALRGGLSWAFSFSVGRDFVGGIDLEDSDVHSGGNFGGPLGTDGVCHHRVAALVGCIPSLCLCSKFCYRLVDTCRYRCSVRYWTAIVFCADGGHGSPRYPGPCDGGAGTWRDQDRSDRRRRGRTRCRLCHHYSADDCIPGRRLPLHLESGCPVVLCHICHRVCDHPDRVLYTRSQAGRSLKAISARAIAFDSI